ncbi:condensation domain-containing protein [Murinocardiopsis flavida]|uniref:Condensation domain-containing protein n=1 Tax=Murinocardiopsis flavida TaxID=645275 RepID=A0A2P8DF82_9ACTN|nr:condensation domain-containing protein [Murinocardiopsis flavida]PSK95873.1 condensation domain-containing protein [Murinocardiopsis flavida]
MLQIPIEDLDVEPGHILEWRLRPTGAAAAKMASDQQRGASFNQDKHLTVAMDARRDNDPLASWVATTFDLPGKLDRAALESALLYFVRRHEVLRCEFRQLAGDVSCTALAPDEVELDHFDIGYIDTTEELRDYIFEFFVKGIDTLGWPLIVMGAVERETHTTMFIAYDHLVSDGMSSPIAVNDVATAYTAYLDGREPDLPAAGSYVDFGHAQRHEYAGIEADDPRLDYWRGFKERNGGFFPPFPLDLGVAQGEMYPTVNQTDKLLAHEELEALDAHCRAAGGRLSMAMLAAIGVALRNAGGPDVYRGLMPVSERGRGDLRNSMGWFVNTMPIEFSVAPEKDFAEVLAGVDSAFRTMLANTDVPFVQAWHLLAPEMADVRSWPYAVNFFSYIDFRKAVGGEALTGWNAKKHIWASRSNGICYWFHRNPDGLYVNLIFADTPQAHVTKAALRESLIATMTRMSRHGSL